MDIQRGPGNEPTPHDCRAIQAQRDKLAEALRLMVREFKAPRSGKVRDNFSKLLAVETAQRALAGLYS